MRFGWALITWIRDEIDHLACSWIIKRKTLDRSYAKLVLERLAERHGAKLEMTETPDTAPGDV